MDCLFFRQSFLLLFHRFRCLDIYRCKSQIVYPNHILHKIHFDCINNGKVIATIKKNVKSSKFRHNPAFFPHFNDVLAKKNQKRYSKLTEYQYLIGQ